MNGVNGALWSNARGLCCCFMVGGVRAGLVFVSLLASSEAGWFTTKEDDLLYYAEHGDYVQVEKLLAAGADANKANKDGERWLECRKCLSGANCCAS